MPFNEDLEDVQLTDSHSGLPPPVQPAASRPCSKNFGKAVEICLYVHVFGYIL